MAGGLTVDQRVATTPVKLLPVPDVSVCVCTFRRPALLKQLLQSLAEQTFPISRLECVVVDNDEAGSAQETVTRFGREHPELTIRYAHELTPGVSHARNRAVAQARAERIAFVDDDEIADRDWLSQLNAAMDRYEADVVQGPTRVHLDLTHPDWVRRVNARSHLDHVVSGLDVPRGAGGTGNVLFRRQALGERAHRPFDPLFARTGGEDTDLFDWILNRGGRIAWCAEARTLEHLSPERLRLRFYVQRALRVSAVHWRGVYRCSNPVRVAVYALAGVSVSLICGLSSLLAWPAGRTRAVPLLLVAMRAAGRVLALTRIELAGYGDNNASKSRREVT